MPSLSDLVKDKDRRKAVIDDCAELIEAEVASKSGLTGLAVKGAFAVVKAVRPGIIPQAVHHLIDEFSIRIDPFHAAWLAQGGKPPLADYFTRRGGELADALLTVTDERASRSDNRTLKGAYGKLRPQGKKHVQDAMPRLGRLVEKHTR